MPEDNILEFRQNDILSLIRTSKDGKQLSQVIEKVGRFARYEMLLRGGDEDMLSDPHNIYVVRLPKTMSASEAEKMYPNGVPEKVVELINSSTPFLPGVTPRGAMLDVFNTLTYQKGSRIFVQQDDDIWQSKMPFKYSKPISEYLASAADKLINEHQTEINRDSPESPIQIPTAANTIRMLYHRLPVGYDKTLSQNPEAIQTLYDQLVLLHAIQDHSELFSETEEGVMKKLANLFRECAPQNPLYAHGKCLVAQGADKHDDKWKLDFK